MKNMYLRGLDMLTLLLIWKLWGISKCKLICFKNALLLKNILLYWVECNFTVIEIKVHFSFPRESKNLLQPQVPKVMQADIYIFRAWLINFGFWISWHFLIQSYFTYSRSLSGVHSSLRKRECWVLGGWGGKESTRLREKTDCMNINE